MRGVSRNAGCGRFERFLPVLIHAEALERSVADREGPGGPALNLDPVASCHGESPGHHHLLTRLDELVRLNSRRLPDADQILQHPANLIERVDAAERTGYVLCDIASPSRERQVRLCLLVIPVAISPPRGRTYGHLMPGSEDEAANLLDAYLEVQRQRAEEVARAAGAELTEALTGAPPGAPVAHGA